jgi:Nickel responsive protein SCO4226-like
VPEFLLEHYVPRKAAGRPRESAERARIAADELTRAGTPVRCLRSIFVPEDETCFVLYEADSIEAVREAARLAGLLDGWVAEAITAV